MITHSTVKVMLSVLGNKHTKERHKHEREREKKATHTHTSVGSRRYVRGTLGCCLQFKTSPTTHNTAEMYDVVTARGVENTHERGWRACCSSCKVFLG